MREYRDINGLEPMSNGSKEFELIKKPLLWTSAD